LENSRKVLEKISGNIKEENLWTKSYPTLKMHPPRSQSLDRLRSIFLAAILIFGIFKGNVNKNIRGINEEML